MSRLVGCMQCTHTHLCETGTGCQWALVRDLRSSQQAQIIHCRLHFNIAQWPANWSCYMLWWSKG